MVTSRLSSDAQEADATVVAAVKAKAAIDSSKAKRKLNVVKKPSKPSPNLRAK